MRSVSWRGSEAYTPSNEFKKGGCMRLNGTDVRWVSGASASIGYLTACASNGYTQTFNFVRPDVPGREVDANYALQLRQTSIMQQAANTQSRAAAAQQQAAQAQMLRAINPPPAPVYVAPAYQQPRSINCTSNQIGQYTYTNCN